MRLSLPLVRALLAMMALVSQITLGGIVLPDEAAARLHAVAAFCTGTTRTPDTPARHQRHPNDAATCPLERALELPAVILMPALVLVSLMVRSGTTLFALPPARGPPAALAWALHARGPPAP